MRVLSSVVDPSSAEFQANREHHAGLEHYYRKDRTLSLPASDFNLKTGQLVKPLYFWVPNGESTP